MSVTRVEQQDRLGNKFYCMEVGSLLYPVYPEIVNEDYSLTLDAIRNLKLKPGDMFISGFIRSGNHWAYEVINMVATKSAEFTSSVLQDDHVDRMSAEKLKAREQSKKPMQYYSHLNVDSIPKSIAETGGIKLIYLVRNYKDMLCSAYNFGKILKVYETHKGPWDEFLELWNRKKGYVYGRWFDHIKQADLYREQNPQVPFHIICFEKMKENPVAEILSLAKFMEVDIDESLAEDIAEAARFAKMRPKLMARKMSHIVEEMCGENVDAFYRKGEVADWKNLFTVAQSEKVDEILNEELPNSPILNIVRPYM